MRTYTFKTLSQSKFQIEFDPERTVSELKEALSKREQEMGNDASVARIKLIFSGKILSDDRTLESYKIEESHFIVLMINKDKKPAPAATSVAPPAQAEAVPAPAVPAPAAATPAASSTPAPIPAGSSVAAQDRSFGDTSSFLSGEALQSSINNMVEMGFPKTDVERAMRAAFNNPDRAVDYLMNGIPAHLQSAAAGAGAAAGASAATNPASQASAGVATPQAPAQAAPAQPAAQSNAPQNLFQLAQQQQQQGQQGVGAGLGGPAAGGLGGLAGLGGAGSGPGGPEGGQMAQLRELVMQNPALIQPMIQQLAQSNPQVAQYLEQNPEALLQILSQVGGDGGEGDDVFGGPGQAPPGAQVVHITPEEREAIERLIGLGFTRDQVVEAYFACDKNEELAANYLFENGADMMDQ